jgi:hypothetical protein
MPHNRTVRSDNQPPMPPPVLAGQGLACPCCAQPMRRWRLGDGVTTWDECTAPTCGSPPTLASLRGFQPGTTDFEYLGPP